MDKIARSSKTYSKLLKQADINESDVMIIWDTASLYIREELSRKRGKHFEFLNDKWKCCYINSLKV